MKSEVRGYGRRALGAHLSDDENEEPPFIQSIMNQPIPPKFKILTFKIYEGVTDRPVEHAEMFEAIIDFHVVSDAIKCRAFQTIVEALPGTGTDNWCLVNLDLQTVEESFHNTVLGSAQSEETFNIPSHYLAKGERNPQRIRQEVQEQAD